MQKLCVAALVAASLAGCAQVEKARDFISDPKTQAAIATVEKGAVIVLCDTSRIAGLTSNLIAAVSVDANGKPISQGAATRVTKSAFVATVSDKVCTGIGGLVAGTATAPAATPVVASVPAA